MAVNRKLITKIVIHLILISTLIVVAFPIYYALVMATHTHQDAYAFPPKLTPGKELFSNIKEAWQRVKMATLLKNSLIIAITVSIGKITFSILAAFAFTHFKFKGSWLLFPLAMVTQMMPLPVRVIPLYRMMAQLGWLNTYWALTVPYLASTTGIILFRQFYLTVPAELADAARVDGATPMQYLRRILLPLSWTNVAALLVIEFVYMWNEYLWPNIAITASNMRVAQMGLRMLYTSERGAAEWNIIMAGTLIIMLPPLIILILFRKQFSEGIAMQTTK
ncbi:MAG: carbohydrate ABC transporter permease [Firmicutes bacterium]|nr:carbohydrate ABC transporter permease [Bacillota bacterium]